MTEAPLNPDYMRLEVGQYDSLFDTFPVVIYTAGKNPQRTLVPQIVLWALIGREIYPAAAAGGKCFSVKKATTTTIVTM